MNDYQKQAARTLIDKPDFELSTLDWRRVINAIALSVTAGMIVEHYKKGIFHQHGYNDEGVTSVLKQVLKIKSEFFMKQQVGVWRGFTNMNVMVVWNVVGLIGEAAEIGQLILDGLAYGKFDKEKLTKELGDCLWYIAALCTELGLDLGEVMAANIKKLELRYPNGYRPQDSLSRVDAINKADL